jgi:DNA-binding NarL/FixJ family response regulator
LEEVINKSDNKSEIRNPQSEMDLTDREVDVLRLLAAGLTNKDIADRLVLSPRTVQAHLYRIFGKLDVTTRSAATRYAVEHDLT